MEVTFDMIRSSPEIRTYITQADVSLTALGFTEHAFAHVQVRSCGCPDPD